VAGYLRHRAALPAGRTVAVLSGGNVGAEALVRVLS